jgi:methylated-DNA-protein-cysteine methyltransferase-like protein
MDQGAENRSLSQRISDVVAAVPPGRVVTYGQVAAMAGNPRAARQVVRILNAWSAKRGLPWFRVVNREGRISLRSGGGMEQQRALLESEGIVFGLDGRIEMRQFQWQGPE